jgi:hypothetical protein
MDNESQLPTDNESQDNNKRSDSSGNESGSKSKTRFSAREILAGAATVVIAVWGAIEVLRGQQPKKRG